MKTCSKCKVPKPEDNKHFRVRIDKRENPELAYFNSECRECERKAATERYNKLKNDIGFKKKNVQRVNEYRIKNESKVKAAQKKKRDNPINKLRRKQYDKAHKERIAQLSKKRNLKYIRKIIANISDQYVIAQLRTDWHRKNGYCAGVHFSEQVINEKRRSIAIHRLEKLLKTLNECETELKI